jgi:hypothetical protein
VVKIVHVLVRITAQIALATVPPPPPPLIGEKFKILILVNIYYELIYLLLENGYKIK